MSIKGELKKMSGHPKTVEWVQAVNDWLGNWKFIVDKETGKMYSAGLPMSDTHICCLLKKDLGPKIGAEGKKLDLIIKACLFGLKKEATAK